MLNFNSFAKLSRVDVVNTKRKREIPKRYTTVLLKN